MSANRTAINPSGDQWDHRNVPDWDSCLLQTEEPRHSEETRLMGMSWNTGSPACAGHRALSLERRDRHATTWYLAAYGSDSFRNYIEREEDAAQEHSFCVPVERTVESH